VSEGSTLEQLERAQAEIEAADPSEGRRLLRTLPWTPENVLKITRAMLEDPHCGDISESTSHSFALELGPEVAREVMPQIEKLRREHFKRLGKPVPKYAGKFLR
jgi:hypothetical protein